MTVILSENRSVSRKATRPNDRWPPKLFLQTPSLRPHLVESSQYKSQRPCSNKIEGISMVTEERQVPLGTNNSFHFK